MAKKRKPTMTRERIEAELKLLERHREAKFIDDGDAKRLWGAAQALGWVLLADYAKPSVCFRVLAPTKLCEIETK